MRAVAGAGFSAVVLMGVFAAHAATTPTRKPDPALAVHQKLIAEIAADLPGMNKVQLVVTHAPHDWPGISDSRHWVRATIQASSSLRYLRLEWQSVLVTALARDLAARLHSPPSIAGISRWWQKRPRGPTRFDAAETLGNPFQTRVERLSEKSLRQRVLRAAKRAKVKLVSLTFLRLLDRTALDLVVRASDTTDYRGGLSVGLYELSRPCGERRPAGCEGQLITVLDKDGKVASKSGFSVRTGIGMGVTPHPLPPPPFP
jgi:hypothetical protein